MTNFIVCDDSEIIRNKVKETINETFDKKSYDFSVTLYDDYDRNFKDFVLRNRKQVVYILDVDMPSESGIDMARMIRRTDKSSIIIILTSHYELSDIIIKARLNILTFISKYDDCKQNLILSLKEALDYFPNSDVMLNFDDLSNSYNIHVKDILYITKDVRKTLIKTDFGDIEVYTSIDKLKKLLPPYFKQSHRSCVVNMKRVEYIDYNNKVICFDNGDNIDLMGDKYKEELVL